MKKQQLLAALLVKGLVTNLHVKKSTWKSLQDAIEQKTIKKLFMTAWGSKQVCLPEWNCRED